MRWYGAFRSDGVYNSEGLLNIRELLKPLYKRDQDIKKVLSKGYPSAESLRKSKMAEMKKKKVQVKVNKSMVDGDKFDPTKDFNE